MGGVPGPYGPVPSYPPNYPPAYPTYPQLYPPTTPYGTVPYPPAGFWARVTSRQKAGLVLGIIGLVLGLLAAFGPFWTVAFSVSQAGMSITIYLDFGMLGAGFSGISLPIPLIYSRTPFLLTGILLLAGVALGTVSVVVGLRRGVTSSRRSSLALAVGAGALTMVAPIYFMLAAPQAVGQLFAGASPPVDMSGFWGSATIPSGGITLLLTWGGGWAWYLAFVAAVFVALGGVLASGSQARPTMGSPVPAYGPASGVAPAPWTPSQPPAVPEPTAPPTPSSPPPADPGAPPDSAANPPE